MVGDHVVNDVAGALAAGLAAAVWVERRPGDLPEGAHLAQELAEVPLPDLTATTYAAASIRRHAYVPGHRRHRISGQPPLRIPALAGPPRDRVDNLVVSSLTNIEHIRATTSSSSTTT